MLIESNDLDTLKHSYPVSRDALDHQATLVNRLALAGDILAVATVAVGSVATYLSLSGRDERRVHVGLLGTSVVLGGRF